MPHTALLSIAEGDIVTSREGRGVYDRPSSAAA